MIINKNITKLDLSNQNLDSFPMYILGLKNLRKLNLSNNRIKEIPREIESLKFLQTLDLSNNQIQNIYSKFFNLKNLRILNLNNNKIKSLPIQILKLSSLISLHISNNSIEDLSESFFTLHNLRELDLSKNNIKKLPSEIKYLNNLRKLWLNNLDLKQFPEQELKNHKSLKALYCFGRHNSNEGTNATFLNLTKIKGNSLTQLKFLEAQIEIVKEVENLKDKHIEPLKNKIFISYSHRDKYWLGRIKTHLKVLKNSLNIEFDVWDDERLETGDNWKERIENSLNDSGIAILVVSTDFLASEFITKWEIPPLLINAKKNGVKILPIVVEPCMFNYSVLSQYQAANDPNKSLSTLTVPEAENHLLTLTRDIKKILLKIKSSSA